MAIRKRLSRLQTEVLEAIIDETRAGKPPVSGQIAEAAGYDGNIYQVLQYLLKKGYIHQPVDRGPYIPLKTPEGTPLRLQLIEAPEDADTERCTSDAA